MDRLGVEQLLSGQAPATCVKLIQRVRVRTAVALASENKKKLRKLFLALLDFARSSIARQDGDLSSHGLSTVYALQRHLLELANDFPEECEQYFSELLRKLSPNSSFSARELAMLKLVTLLFPCTDFQHPVVTPATLLADHWASQLAQLGEGIEDLVSEGSMRPRPHHEIG